jgi:hypothetical protein
MSSALDITRNIVSLLAVGFGALALFCGPGAMPALAQDCGELVQQIPGWGTDFGVSLDIDGDTMVIAAFKDIRVYTRVGADGPWELEATLDPEDDDNPFGLGRYARIDRERILVQGQSSRVYVFERQAVGTWKRVATMLPPDGEIGSVMGDGLALAGDVAVFAEIKLGGIPVKVHEYQRQEDGTWMFMTTLPQPDPPPSNDYATSIAYEDGTLVAGDGLKNRIYVFERDGDGAWTQVQTIEDLPLDDNAFMIAMSSGRIAARVSTSPAQVGVFSRDADGMFVLDQAVEGTDVQFFDNFGYSLAMQGDLLVVGAWWTDAPGAQDSGAVYVFARESDGVWRERTRVTPPEPQHLDYVGQNLAIDGGTLVTTKSTFNLSALVFDVSTCDEPAHCPADCNDDGAVNIFDFLCFQGLVSTGDPKADCTGNGAVNIFDFLCFQGLVTQGCP